METILIKGGTLIDGTGSPSRKADLVIQGDSIIQIAENPPGSGDVVIDASGLHVCPGFIDMHSHSDLSILNDEYSPEKLLQGVTTELVGNCGIGAAPCDEMMLSVLNSVAKDVMYGKEIPLFKHLSDFHEAIGRMGHSINLASLVPHGNVRVMSPVGLVKRDPTADELDEMKAFLDSNMAAGAFGMSTGLIYPPGSITSTFEIAELCKVVSEHGGFYASHVRNEGSGVVKAIEEAIQIGNESGASVHVSHLKVAFSTWITGKLLRRIQRARDAGVDITADVYPYIAGSANLGSIVLPPWVFAGGPKQLVRNLKKKREQIIDEAIVNLMKFAKIPEGLHGLMPKWFIKAALGFLTSKVMITNAKNTEDYKGMFLDKVLKREEFKDEKGIFNKVIALLAQEEGGITIAIFQESEKKTLIPIMKAPFVMVGTDSIAGHPRTWGSYPRIIGKYVRDEGIMSLETAVHKMTGMPAARLGLGDRGVLKAGAKADVVVFDYQKIIDHATYDEWDAPPDGIVHVLVNGHHTVRDGVHLKVKHGRILKPEEKESTR